MVEAVEDGLENTDKEDAAQSEADRTCKADITVQVAEKSAVIPPAHAPLPFKPYPGGIFQERAYKGGNGKNADRLPAQAVEQQEKKDAAEAINRQIRPAVHTPVYKCMRGYQVKRCFPKPSGKGGSKK